MVLPIDKETLRLVTREQGENLVLDKINELVREQQRLEQIVDFLSQVANSYEGNNDLTDDTDVQ